MTTKTIRKIAVPKNELLAVLLVRMQDDKVLSMDEMLVDYTPEYMDGGAYVVFTVGPVPPEAKP